MSNEICARETGKWKKYEDKKIEERGISSHL
jgi:hypothetical protein